MTKPYDPRMHSAEHMLNRAMVNLFGCGRCFSAHINKKKSKCDYRFDRDLTREEITAIQEEVNRQIRKDHPVTAEMMPADEAARLYNIERVPDRDEAEELRIVHIGDYDACPCIGPHVSSTKEIGMFRITTQGFEDGVLRIRFKLS